MANEDDFFSKGYNDPWTVEQKAEAERLLRESNLTFDRRGGAEIVSGRLQSLGIGQKPVVVVIFNPDRPIKTILSTRPFLVGEAVILWCGTQVKGAPGEIVWVRPGLRRDDPANHWYLGFKPGVHRLPAMSEKTR